MKVYKFKDDVDGNYIFIIAHNLPQAGKAVNQNTSIPCTFIESKMLEELDKPIVIFNNILPF